MLVDIDLMNAGHRRLLIEEIKSSEEKERRDFSYEQWRIYKGNLKQPVIKKLLEQLSRDSVAKMPIVYHMNMAKKVVDQEASIYKERPERAFLEVNDAQDMAIKNIYKAGRFDVILKRLNRAVRLQKQQHAAIIPVDGKLKMKQLKNHHLTVVPNKQNPERGEIYVFSAYDQELGGDNKNIGDQEDYQATLERYVVWSEEYNFIMDGAGKILSEDIENPIAPVIPIVDIHEDKDNEYWVDQSGDVTDFTVHFNAMLSKKEQVVDLQAYAQAVVSGPKEIIPKVIQVGPTKVLRLITDPRTGQSADFKFVSPSANISDIEKSIEAMVNYFLSTRGENSTNISGNPSTQHFSSASERLLAMIEKFEASQDDIELFRDAENQVFNIVKAWHNTLNGTETLMDELTVGADISPDAKVLVDYSKPEMLQTQKEREDMWRNRIEAGAASRVDMIEDIYDLESHDEAIERAIRIDQEEINLGKDTRTNTNENGSFPGA